VFEEVWDANIDLNLKSAFLCCKSAVPAMLDGGGGSIVNISSVAGMRYLGRDMISYQASKGGRVFFIGVFAAVVAGLAATRLGVNEYYFFAGYMVLQFVVIATAWNILGGYAGYVNFGSAGFFAIGVYCSIALIKAVDLPLPLLIVAGAIAAGIVGLATGYLTLRLRGVYFAIATLALAIVLETLVANWGYVGGASGTIVMRPREVMFFDSYVEFLFVFDVGIGCKLLVTDRAQATTKAVMFYGASNYDGACCQYQHHYK
jgi:branched-chain amino acid transport system permease protein